MFFKNINIYIFFKFLWIGLIFGAIKIIFDITNRFFHENIYIYNILSFIFWLGFGIVFILLCNEFYGASFCWFGLLGMFLGLELVKYSLNFFLTSLIVLIYHKVKNIKLRKKLNEKK